MTKMILQQNSTNFPCAARLLHQTHARCGEFQISPHLSCGKTWISSRFGEIFDLPTIAIYGMLKILHMAIFSPLMILVILVTNMRSVLGQRCGSSIAE